ncbi:MAG: SpoIIE family protein phosphatase [Candidatus Brocadiia bacterium]
MVLRIRTKLLVLLLVVALLPAGLAAFLHRSAMLQLGRTLAAGTRQKQTTHAADILRQTVLDYARIIQRDRSALEQAVRLQAREVERRLASPAPNRPRLYFNSDYAVPGRQPAGLHPSGRHFRVNADGQRIPIEVTYGEQVYYVVDGISRAAVAEDMARLATMPEVYAFIHRARPELMYWQYTSLESGFHSSYPGHGGYPPGYDPRTREWYTRAREQDGIAWLVMPEVSSRTVAQTVALAVHRPDDRFAGVTAIDVPFGSLFQALRLPGAWSSESEAMLVVLEAPGSKTPRAKVLVHREYQRQGEDWRMPLRMRYLEPDQPEKLRQMLSESRERGAAVARMDYRGRDSFWACSAARANQPFPMVVVPYGLIVADAVAAEETVLARTGDTVRATGLLLIAVGLLAAIIAFVVSRKVSGPVGQLVDAAEQLARGDYTASVDIRTGDELHELGQVFNAMGPQLREHARMKHSLELAMEIQQNLLPRELPHLEGFDVYGGTRYCDRTGGDYFDFIDLSHVSPNILGIVVGDVSGHGIPAALMMAFARGVFRAHAENMPEEPAVAIKALNSTLVRDTTDENFMTVFYALLDSTQRLLYWTSAGHDPALLIRRASGTIERLGTPALPAGIFEGADYGSSGPVELASGDAVVIGTDGIWEARNSEGDMYGHQRLDGQLAACREASAARIYETVITSLLTFCAGRPLEDDVTLVVVKAL